MFEIPEVRIDTVKLTMEDGSNCEIALLREDLIHKSFGGNKIRKLKYHLRQFFDSGKSQILTFGGAWSNHIYASAMLFKELNIPSVGIIRGKAERFVSDTLKDAEKAGMKLVFFERSDFKKATNDIEVQSFFEEYKDSFFIPEGGSGKPGVEGCTEILGSHTDPYSIICCPVGTGGTISGLISSSENHQKVIGFSALKGGSYVMNDIRKWIIDIDKLSNLIITDEFSIGGFARTNDELIRFMRDFEQINGIKLDALYTGKMLLGIKKMIERKEIKSSDVLAVHTGGLQGNRGVELKLEEKIYN